MRTGLEWDEWFLEMCNTVSKKSQCLSRKIGSVLVRDKSIVATGYNGPPRGVVPCDERWHRDEYLRKAAGFEGLIPKETYDSDMCGKCPRYVAQMGFKSGEGLDWCVAGHSERNSLINAARNGICTKGTKLYMNCGIPCHNCLTEIINAGVDEIIVTKFQFYDVSSEYILTQSKLKYRVFEHLKESRIYGKY